MPSAHRRHAEWTPARMMAAAEKIGPSTTALFEAACRRAVSINARSVASVRSILKSGLDQAFLELESEPSPLHHANIGGRTYYH